MAHQVNFLPALTGSFSSPAEGNPTVEMIEAAYRHHLLHFRYINCEVSPAGLEDAIKGAKAMGWVGFNCSLPHKVTVLSYIDELGESAKIIGAVNTVVRRDDKWIGENTDGKGFVEGLRTLTDPAGKNIVIFGAGGAARAVAVELALAKASKITIVNRHQERGEELAALLNTRTPVKAIFHPWNSIYSIPPATDIVINVTSVGLFPDTDARLDVDFNTLLPAMIVADGIPNPPETNLLKEAAKRGCRTLNGLEMLVNQGAIAVKYWTGTTVDRRVMKATLESIFGA